MNAINRLTTAVFDVLLAPLEFFGDAVALILVSGIFGILALLVFKQISWQAGIKATKDKIKGHMIAIRIYQDDLAVVFGSVIKVLLRNLQYLGLNFGPIVPLLAPFVLILAQFVVRYAYQPLPVVSEAELAHRLPGRGTMVEVRSKKGHEAEFADLRLELPDNFRALSPLARSGAEGLAVQEIAAVAPGAGEIRLWIGDRVVGTKAIAAGDEVPRRLQPQRVAGFWSAWLFPAEDTLEADSPISSVSFEYPERDLGMLPGGELGVMLTFLVASMAFGIAILKPLNIQI
jgi:hypothetical protein